MEIREKEQVKQRVQRRIVLCSVMLMAGKFAAYFLTNSVGVLTDAMESIVNVTAGLISLYSLYRAARPADRNHPFGYGKIELISASIEGLLILLAGAAIVYEGIRRLFVPSQIEQLDTGIAIVAAAGAVNYLLGLYSIRTGRRYDSVALVAGGRHLQSDTYSTIGLVAGLVLLYVTRIGWIDSALAMLFGGIIAWTGISILRKTASDLMDTADERYLEKMLETVSRHPRPDWIDIHNLKIIRYGSYAYRFVFGAALVHGPLLQIAVCALFLPAELFLHEAFGAGDDAHFLHLLLQVYRFALCDVKPLLRSA